MGALPRGLLVLGVCAVLAVAVLADASPASSMVVGLAKCADCTRKNMKAEAAFTGLQVAVKCKNANGEYETKAVGAVDRSGAFGVPLSANLLREDGDLKQDCFAQLHSAPDHPCPGQEPSWIVRQSPDAAEKKGFVAVPGKMHYSSKECASAFLCHPFHKKHLFHKKPALVIPHLKKKPIYHPPAADQKTALNPETDPQLFKKLLHKKPIVIPHFHKKPAPVPEYKPPTPTPVYTHPTPVPEHKPPTPVYTHPTPINHPPADQKMVQDPETDPQLFKKLLPFIKKNPFFKKFPPAQEDTKP